MELLLDLLLAFAVALIIGLYAELLRREIYRWTYPWPMSAAALGSLVGITLAVMTMDWENPSSFWVYLWSTLFAAVAVAAVMIFRRSQRIPVDELQAKVAMLKHRDRELLKQQRVILELLREYQNECPHPAGEQHESTEGWGVCGVCTLTYAVNPVVANN